MPSGRDRCAFRSESRFPTLAVAFDHAVRSNTVDAGHAKHVGGIDIGDVGKHVARSRGVAKPIHAGVGVIYSYRAVVFTLDGYGDWVSLKAPNPS